MRFFYQGKDITDRAEVLSAVHTDYSDGQSDTLQMELGTAVDWDGWNPQTNDILSITHDGFRTGNMYLQFAGEVDGHYHIIATGVPKSIHERGGWNCWENKSFAIICGTLAGECGVGFSTYGGNPGVTYAWMERHGEGAAAYLRQLANMEGYLVKAQGGSFKLIHLDYAQGLSAVRKVAMDGSMEGLDYKRLDAQQFSAISVYSDGKSTTASGSASGGKSKMLVMPYANDAYARFANNMLRMHNRRMETLTLQLKFDAVYSAAVRVDVEGNTRLDGQWLVDTCIHDFINNTSEIKMMRCV